MFSLARALPRSNLRARAWMMDLLCHLARMRAANRQRQDLARLDPHLRRDIGLSDDEIRREIQRPAWDIPEWWR